MEADPTTEEELDFWSFVDIAIARAHREIPTLDPNAMRLVLSLHRAATSVVYDLESTVHRPRGWSWPAFRVLFVLWLAEPLESKRVAELAGMSRAAVSDLVSRLTRDGLVQRDRSLVDRRAVALRLTETARASFVSAFTAHNEREQLWASALTGDELATLASLLEKLMASSVATGARRRI